MATKEIRVVDQARGIVRVTTADERWYGKSVIDDRTGLPASWLYVPSVTWITSFYPKGPGFYRWLATQGWDEAQAIKRMAADKGSKIHQAIAQLLDGERITLDSLFPSPSTGLAEPLTMEEYDAVLAFAAWWGESPRKLLLKDTVVWSPSNDFAGTLDLLYEEGGALWLVDIKSGREIWPEYELQVSAYKAALPANFDPFEAGGGDLLSQVQVRLGLLQVGYTRNRAGWKFTEVEDQLALFRAAQAIWKKETAGQEPAQKDYPLSVALGDVLDRPAPAKKARRG